MSRAASTEHLLGKLDEAKLNIESDERVAWVHIDA
jgi:hypothetical protein